MQCCLSISCGRVHISSNLQQHLHHFATTSCIWKKRTTETRTLDPDGTGGEMQRSGTFSLQHLLRPCLHPGARAALLSHVQTMLRHATLLIHARFQCQRLRSGQLQLLREISPLPNGHTTQPHVKLLNLLPHCHVALTHKLASTLALTPKVAMPPWV